MGLGASHETPASWAHTAAKPLHQAPRPMVMAAAKRAEPSVQISVSAHADLLDCAERLDRATCSLPVEGQGLLRALLSAMCMAVAEDRAAAPHFESQLREQISAQLGAGIELERMKSGQWKASGGAAHRGFVLSVRTEVLGASPAENVEFLAKLKDTARAVRTTLLSDGADWMRRLSKGASQGQFLAACSSLGTEHSGERRARARAYDDDDDDGDCCEFCQLPLNSALLGGRHMCHIKCTFRCPECRGQWSSVQARFDPAEERVLGQKCQACQQFGDELQWWFSDAPAAASEARERKPHRQELCEACDRFGNCKGAFFEPFVMSSGIALHAGRPGTQWVAHGSVLVANAGPFSVAMLPHVFSCAEEGQATPARPRTSACGGSKAGGKRGSGGDRGDHKGDKAGD